MKPIIRTVTGFISIKDFHRFDELFQKIKLLKTRCTEAGYEVQTVRITTDIIEGSKNPELLEKNLEFIKGLEDNQDISLYHLGSFTEENKLDIFSSDKILDIFLKNKKSFLTFDAGSVTPSKPLCIQAAKFCKDIAKEASFECRRFAIYAGVKETTPFYPASRVFTNSMKIAVGLQCANLAVEEATKTNQNYEKFEQNLTMKMETEFDEVLKLIPDEVRESFIGFDTSLAPFPSDETSIVNAIEILLGKPFGSSGTLAVCRLLTKVMKENNIRKTGLCGLMLPVVEDNVLAKRGIENRYSLKELLLYSSVCATGLDTVPISGSNSVEDLADCYFDLSTLAIKLSKPLSARFFIEPDKQPGETVKYDWKFACESPIFKL